MANAITNQPGIFNSLVEGTREGVNWLSTNAKNLSENAGDTLGRVWSAVSDFFSKIPTWLQEARDGIFAAKDQIMAMPTEGKVVGLVAVIGAAFAGILFGKSWTSAPAATPAPAEAAAEQPARVADPAAARVADPAAAPVADPAAAPVADPAAARVVDPAAQ